MRFKNREEAAHLLLKKLIHYRGTNPLVLGIPRGAVPMAAIVAKGLMGELSIILVHKISAPDNPEFAIASIGLSGKVQFFSSLQSISIPESYLKVASKKQLDLLKERQRKYNLNALDYQNRNVIIVDDGIATGATTLAAIQEVKIHKPKKIIVASPVAARDSAEKIKHMVDELVILELPDFFYAVGQFFEDFSQVSDEEVIEILQNQNK